VSEPGDVHRLPDGTLVVFEPTAFTTTTEHTVRVEVAPAGPFGHDGEQWPVMAIFPGGLLAWVGFAYAAHRAGGRAWWAATALWLAVALASLVAGFAGEPSLAALLWGVGWAGGTAHAFAARPRWREAVRVREAVRPAEDAARLRLAQRERAKQLVREQPALALEMGVGRPDLTGAEHGGVVDVNHAPAAALGTIPGVDGELAARIVALREDLGGFSSAAELATTLDVAPHLADDLARHTVYLPR
jgi:DNA uptake protein ComE-like DNA-binding protein